MESFLSFFEDIPSSYRSLILVSGLVIFWIVEGIFPLFRLNYRRYRHAALNVIFTLTTLVVNFSLAFLIVRTSDLTVSSGFGAMQWLMETQAPLWLSVLLGFLILDFISSWLIHLIEHKVRWMWKFHLIHHTDTHIDVTSALRHHPGESIFRAVFTILAILFAGAPIGMVFIYQTVSALFSQFNHANFSMPKSIDRLLSWIFVTPDMHKVHHHYTRPLTDTNYGNIFSFWDRIFRTFAEVKNTSELVYGVDTHMEETEHDALGNLMAIPFQPYRERPSSVD